jgi:hypothetical protein
VFSAATKILKIPFGNIFEGFLTRFYNYTVYAYLRSLRWIKCIREVIFICFKIVYFIFLGECWAVPVSTRQAHLPWAHPWKSLKIGLQIFKLKAKESPFWVYIYMYIKTCQPRPFNCMVLTTFNVAKD